MTVEERLKELLQHGCVIHLHTPIVDRGMELPLGGAILLRKPPRLRFFTPFPGGQQDFHEIRFDRVELETNDRDIAFYRKAERGWERVAGIFPYEEGGLDENKVAATLNAWRRADWPWTDEEMLADP